MRTRATPLLLVLALTLTACGSATAASAPSPDLDQLVDDYYATWTDYESDAFFDLVTDDYEWVWENQVFDARSKMVEIERYEFVNFRVDFTSDRLWTGDGPTYYMSQSHSNYTDTGFPGPDGNTSISVLEIVEHEDRYLVARHSFFAEGGRR
jgi:hypothetical protein